MLEPSPSFSRLPVLLLEFGTYSQWVATRVANLHTAFPDSAAAIDEVTAVSGAPWDRARADAIWASSAANSKKLRAVDTYLEKEILGTVRGTQYGIVRHLFDRQNPSYVGTGRGQQAWLALRERHIAEEANVRNELRQSLRSMRLSAYNSFAEFEAAYLDKFNDLSATGLGDSEDTVVDDLLTSFPDDYTTTCSAIRAWPRSDRNVRKALLTLRAEALAIARRSGSVKSGVGPAVALQARLEVLERALVAASGSRRDRSGARRPVARASRGVGSMGPADRQLFRRCREASPQRCFPFLKGGSCPRGPGCKFSHTSLPPPTALVSSHTATDGVHPSGAVSVGGDPAFLDHVFLVTTPGGATPSSPRCGSSGSSTPPGVSALPSPRCSPLDSPGVLTLSSPRPVVVPSFPAPPGVATPSSPRPAAVRAVPPGGPALSPLRRDSDCAPSDVPTGSSVGSPPTGDAVARDHARVSSLPRRRGR